MDAFTVDGGKENNWVCPPISLIPRIIRHAQVCMARATMLVPVWTTAAFWPLLCPDGAGCFAPFVREARALPRVATLFLPGLSGACLFGGEVTNTDVWVLRCDFSGRESPLVDLQTRHLECARTHRFIPAVSVEQVCNKCEQVCNKHVAKSVWTCVP